MALPKQNRLKQQQDFAAVYKRGIRHATPHLVLRALPLRQYQEDLVSDTSQLTRIGIVVSQKISKRAVVRNRIKRQLRAACRRLLSRLLPGWFIVITPRVGSLECDYHQFLRELEQLLVNAEILNGD